MKVIRKTHCQITGKMTTETIGVLTLVSFRQLCKLAAQQADQDRTVVILMKLKDDTDRLIDTQTYCTFN